jgi:hypothetical protein
MKNILIPLLLVIAAIVAAGLESDPAHAGYSCISYKGKQVCCYTFSNYTTCQ